MSVLLTKTLGFFFDTLLGNALAAVLLVLTTFGTWLIHHDSKVELAATNAVILELNTQAEKITDEALKAREPAARPGAAARLRAGSCSDCQREAVLPDHDERLR